MKKVLAIDTGGTTLGCQMGQLLRFNPIKKPNKRTNNMRFQLTATNYFLFIREGNLREIRNDEGESIGFFAPMTVELEIVEGNKKGKYLLSAFQSEGYGSRAETDQMIERIRTHGSVNLTKGTQIPNYVRTFDQCYLENMAYSEREERFEDEAVKLIMETL